MFELTARVYAPPAFVIQQLRDVYCTALKLDSWGVVLPILAQSFSKGGYQLIMPHVYLLWQHTHCFVRYVHQQVALPPIMVTAFQSWCQQVGFHPNPDDLFLLQVGMVQWRSMPSLGLHAKSFSKVRKGLPVIMPPGYDVSSMPLWHNALLADVHSNTYYSARLALDGVLFLSHAFTRQQLNSTMVLPPVASTVYCRAFELATQAKARSVPAAFTSVYDMWRKWTSRPMPLLLNSLVLMEPRQPEAAGPSCVRPPVLFEFAHQALWRKLRTLPRLQPWLHEPGLCPICNTPETYEHVLTECKYLKIAVKVISQCFADYRHGDDTLSLPQLLNSPPDVVLSAPVGPVV